ncbi:TIGR01244 family sulfur transferase [Blastomonas fulva]|uniref:TIGR01244 family sulfur transferase n=1 Tax=Blastomonas fulva TaxID=1550728 RepID=UPI003D2A2F96
MFTPLTETIEVSPQISIDQVAAAKAQGVTMIINNRPDGEDPSAPQGADIAAAAEAAGIDYVAIPVTHAGFSGPQVDAMIAALGKAEGSGGKVLAYCRSGTRSTLLWSLAQAKQGRNPAELSRVAANAGYDLSPIRPMLDALSGQVN